MGEHQQRRRPDDSVNIGILTNHPKSVEERVYLRWSTDFFITSHMVGAAGSGLNYSATIPAQPAGTGVQDRVTTSTADLSALVTSGTIDPLTLATSSNSHFVVAPGANPSPTPTATPPPTPTATPSATATATIPPSPTPTATPTATPTSSPTPTPTSTPTPAPGSFAEVILATEPANLKGYWKCNETSGTTLADSSGNSKNLTITGAINTNYWLGEAGEQGTCFRTDGVAGYASRNDSVIPSLNSTNFTLFALFKGGTDFTAGNALSISSSLSGNDRAGMGAAPSSSTASAQARGNSTIMNSAFTGGTAFNGSWHAVAFRRNGTAFNIFVDGVSVATTTATLATGSTCNRTSLMHLLTSGTTQYAKGRIQHAAIWNRALSDSEIVAIQTARSINPTPTPTPSPTPTPTTTATPTATATATFTPTPTATATFTPTPTAMATFTPTPTATFAPTPALSGLTYNGGAPFVDGTNLVSGTSYTVTAQANAATRSVVFHKDGSDVKTDSAVPFDFTWTPSVLGNHPFTATPWSSINGTGTSGASMTVTYTVVAASSPTPTPTSTLTPTGSSTPTPTPGSFAEVILATEPANLKGYWKCDEASGTTLADSSGNSKNLTITGAINANYWLGEAGEQGTCFRTDGVAGYASRNDSVIPSLNSTNFTLFALFKGGTDFTAGNALSISSSLSGNDRAGMGAAPSSSTASAQARGNSTIMNSAFTGGTAFNGSWHAVAFRRNGTAFNIFVDGVSVATTTATLATGSTCNRTSLMHLLTSGTTQYAKGSIQHAAIWNRALSDSEIVAIQTARSINPTPTPTPSPTPTPTTTATPTATATSTFTPTPAATATFTPTATATATATFTPTPTATATFTPTATVEPSATATATIPPSPTPTATDTVTPTPTATATFTPTPTANP